jgi:hypothetical protein
MPGKSIDAEIARLRAALDAFEAEMAPPNPPLDRPSLARSLTTIADLQRQIKKLEDKLQRGSRTT